MTFIFNPYIAPPPVEPEVITHGSQINAGNTGYTAYLEPTLGRLLVLGDLDDHAGGTLSDNDEVFVGRHFTGPVEINAPGLVFRGCLFEVEENADEDALYAPDGSGADLTLDYCTVVAAGGGASAGVRVGGGNGPLSVHRCDVTNFENLVTSYRDDTAIEESYLHGPQNASAAGPHHDCVELYGGSRLLVARSRITMRAEETAPVNVAPWGGGSCDEVDVLDNLLDGGNVHVIFDAQGSGHIHNMRVLRNQMGGHTNPFYGTYAPYRGPTGSDPVIVRTAAEQLGNPNTVLWPSSGDDVNTWAECDDLDPDLTGQVIS